MPLPHPFSGSEAHRCLETYQSLVCEFSMVCDLINEDTLYINLNTTNLRILNKQPKKNRNVMCIRRANEAPSICFSFNQN